jgi:hypothetical protein
MMILLLALLAACALTAFNLSSQSGLIWSIVTTALDFDETLFLLGVCPSARGSTTLSADEGEVAMSVSGRAICR